MRDVLSNVFSYLFMGSAVICLISALGVIIVFIRSLVQDIGINERNMGFYFLYIVIISAVLAPVFLFVSNRLEKYSGRMDEV